MHEMQIYEIMDFSIVFSNKSITEVIQTEPN